MHGGCTYPVDEQEIKEDLSRHALRVRGSSVAFMGQCKDS